MRSGRRQSSANVGGNEDDLMHNTSAVVHSILSGHNKPISFVAWSPDDSMLLTAANDHLVRLWDVQVSVWLG